MRGAAALVARRTSMKFGNSIFRKMLFSGFLLVAVSLLIMDFYLTRYLADQQTNDVTHLLTAQARDSGRRTRRA